MQPVYSNIRGEDPEFDKAIDYYVNGLAQVQQEIKSALKKRNWAMLKGEFHKLKGSGAAFGYANLSVIAENIESHLEHQKFAAAEHSINELNNIISAIQLGERMEKSNITETDNGNGDEAPIYSEIRDTDPELVHVVECFLDGLPHTMDQVNQLYADGQWPALKNHIHNLKGSGGAFGFPQITEVAREIHQCIVSGNYSNIASYMAQLNTIYRRIKAGHVDSYDAQKRTSG